MLHFRLIVSQLDRLTIDNGTALSLAQTRSPTRSPTLVLDPTLDPSPTLMLKRASVYGEPYVTLVVSKRYLIAPLTCDV